jgi:hypothetical protein
VLLRLHDRLLEDACEYALQDRAFASDETPVSLENAIAYEHTRPREWVRRCSDQTKLRKKVSLAELAKGSSRRYLNMQNSQ